MCFQTRGKVMLASGFTVQAAAWGVICERKQRTFSRPKNLSVPSPRSGPAFCNIFSKGVSSDGGSSFFLFGDTWFAALAAA